jgi:hypothetical protein
MPGLHVAAVGVSVTGADADAEAVEVAFVDRTDRPEVVAICIAVVDRGVGIALASAGIGKDGIVVDAAAGPIGLTIWLVGRAKAEAAEVRRVVVDADVIAATGDARLDIAEEAPAIVVADDRGRGVDDAVGEEFFAESSAPILIEPKEPLTRAQFSSIWSPLLHSSF